MSSLSEISLEPLTEAKFVKTQMMHYREQGVQKSWEIAQVHDSVSVLMYHKSRDAFILVKQMRPAVYLKNSDGFTFELCAGICDKELSLAQIASEEILEECGYDVPASNLEKITSFYTAVGFAGAQQTSFYVEVDESMKKTEGGGIDMEDIEVIELPVKDAQAFMFDETKAKTPGLMFAFMWWLMQKR